MRFQKKDIRFVSRNSQIRDVLKRVDHVADTDATVLITGESGTGKDLIAQLLHQKSSRYNKPFIAINCGALSDTLLESELLGHSAGAFTGAISKKIGKFEAANGGTIFLDEMSEMSKLMQVKLLRVLQSGEFSPVGVAENRFCDVRIIAATNRDLFPLIEEGSFRNDLYYRLNIIQFKLAPLRARKEDLDVLVPHFLNKYGSVYDKVGLRMCADTLRVLMTYDFPGNVRELENIIQGAVINCRDGLITPDCIQLEGRGKKQRSLASAEISNNFHEAKASVIEEFERDFLVSVLQKCGGIVSRAAMVSGLSERNFYAKLRKYDIPNMALRTGQPTTN